MEDTWKGQKKGVIFKPGSNNGLEWYVDAYVPGGWDNVASGKSEATLFRTGYVLMNETITISIV